MWIYKSQQHDAGSDGCRQDPDDDHDDDNNDDGYEDFDDDDHDEEELLKSNIFAMQTV